MIDEEVFWSELEHVNTKIGRLHEMFQARNRPGPALGGNLAVPRLLLPGFPSVGFPDLVWIRGHGFSTGPAVDSVKDYLGRLQEG